MNLFCKIFVVFTLLVVVRSSTNLEENDTDRIATKSEEDHTFEVEALIKVAPKDDDTSFEVEIPPGPDNKSVLGCSAEICFGVCLLQGRYGGCRRDKCKCKGKFP